MITILFFQIHRYRGRIEAETPQSWNDKIVVLEEEKNNNPQNYMARSDGRIPEMEINFILKSYKCQSTHFFQFKCK